MRGSRTLFADIFENDTPKAASQRKGRSADLHARRNECLVDRHYYYGKYYDKRYSAIVEILSKEFFLSQITIIEAMADNYGHFARLRKEEPPIKHFKEKWPHLAW
jgi:hypothetical protein